MTGDRSLLRHTLATLAYRGGKVLRGAPADFATFRAAEGVRTPGEVLSHIGDLLDWALGLVQGRSQWKDAPPLPWEDGSARFFEALEKLDGALALEAPTGEPSEKLFQGPIADALTHVGQLALLRRMAGAPVRGENYLKADIHLGRVGREQSAARREF